MEQFREGFGKLREVVEETRVFDGSMAKAAEHLNPSQVGEKILAVEKLLHFASGFFFLLSGEP